MTRQVCQHSPLQFPSTDSRRSPASPLRKTLLAASVAATLGWGAPAYAFEFSLADGEVKGSFDTTLSYGILMRADKRDPALVGRVNGGTASSVNFDDGNRTYDRGDVVSSIFRMVNELELNYRNYGFFGRTLAFYDTALAGKSTTANGAGLSDEAVARLKDDTRILDFYVRGSFDLGGKNLNARLGRQVVNWGESTFIPNGINIINPVDVARLRAPGSEIKDGLLPQEMLWASQEVTDNVSVEAFYQFKWRETRIDPRGSFFSTNDFLSPGASTVYAGFGQFPDNPSATGAQFANRTGNNNPSDNGQYGIATRVLLPQLNNTELGFYFINYHSRTPFVSSTRGGVNAKTPGPTVVSDPGNPANSTSQGAGNPPNTNAQAATYRAEFPEDIRLIGLSASGSGPSGIALQGEYSYRPNQPISLGAVEFLLGTLGAGNAAGIPPGPPPPQGTGNQPGTRIEGWRRVKMHQLQGTGTKSFGPQLGSSQLTLVGELGFTYLDLPDDVLFDGPATNVASRRSSTGQGTNLDDVNGKGYATRRSWGYRLLTRADYPNALGSWTLTPRLAFSHDVRGVSPTFNQGSQSFSVGMTGTLRNQWTVDLSYTAFMGGRTYSGRHLVQGAPANPVFSSSSANLLKDRDFIAATVSYAF